MSHPQADELVVKTEYKTWDFNHSECSSGCRDSQRCWQGEERKAHWHNFQSSKNSNGSEGTWGSSGWEFCVFLPVSFLASLHPWWWLSGVCHRQGKPSVQEARSQKSRRWWGGFFLGSLNENLFHTFLTASLYVTVLRKQRINPF